MAKYTIPISDFFSLRLYSDTNPHHQHIADLQKGLILVYKGIELVGEGTGFGVPVARYRSRTYFPGSSTVQVLHKKECTIVHKQFVLDTVLEMRFRHVRIENKAIRSFARYMAELYKKHRHWRPVLQQNFLKYLGTQDRFVKAKPAGNVTVTYLLDTAIVNVKADFEFLKRDNLEKICLLNEQSSRFFRKYFDSNGIVLLDKQIGEWEKVESEWACISNASGEKGFRLWKVKDTLLYRGREFFGGSLDWVGLDYEVGSEIKNLEYNIELFERLEQN